MRETMTHMKQTFEQRSLASKKGWERRWQRERETYLAERQKASILQAEAIKSIFDAHNAHCARVEAERRKKEILSAVAVLSKLAESTQDGKK